MGFSAERSFGRSFRFGGGQFGAKFFAKFAAKFSTKFSALFCWDIQSKKIFSKNFSPEFPWPCTAKLEKFQGKNFMTRFCRGDPSPRKCGKFAEKWGFRRVPACAVKHVLCVPFFHGWWGSCGQQTQAISKGP